jgi:hypothetical protein
MKANDHGYVRLMENHERDYEHRRVWISHNGQIPAGMVVHHINKDTADNRIENLRLVSPSEHIIIHSTARNEHGMKRCTICGEFKPESEFAKCKGGSPQGPCKPCKSRYNRRYSASSRRLQRKS